MKKFNVTIAGATVEIFKTVIWAKSTESALNEANLFFGTDNVRTVQEAPTQTVYTGQQHVEGVLQQLDIIKDPATSEKYAALTIGKKTTVYLYSEFKELSKLINTTIFIHEKNK